MTVLAHLGSLLGNERDTMNFTKEQIRAAAKYFLRYQGQRGTEKQIDGLVARIYAPNIVRMAAERNHAESIEAMKGGAQ